MRKFDLYARAFIAALTLALFTLPAKTALATTPIRDPQLLWAPEKQKALHLATASVLIADYELIRRDFPEVAEYSNPQIDAWLIANAAFISPEQASQSVVNTKIKTDGEREAYRPREYRRAHVFVTDTGGLIDAKGTGSVDPHQGFERNGLATASDMLREFIWEKLAKRIFTFVRKFDTVGSYGVLDTGFDVIQADGSRTRAGIILRQAHTRYHKGTIGKREREDPVVLPNEHQLEVELTLRRFGLSGCIDLWPGMYSVKTRGDQLNIQGSSDLAVIDFGGFRAKARFELPIFATYSKEGHADVSDSDILLATNSERFVQPDPDLKVPFELWGNTMTGENLDNPYVLAEEVSQLIRRGGDGRAAAEALFAKLITPVDQKLRPRLPATRTAPGRKQARVCREAFGV